MKNKKLIIAIIIAIVAISVVAVTMVVKKSKSDDNNASENTQSNNPETINQIKEEINATANNDIYEVEQEETTGRQILQIKPNVQYQTALAGILKNSMPQEQEIEELLKNSPNKSGIWISKQSRDAFLKLLNDNYISEFEINEEGYLIQKQETENEKANLLKQALKTDKLYIIDISGKYYIRDYLSGQIIEEPFEEMDPEQTLQKISSEDKNILVITTNSKSALSKKEILEDILLNTK